MQRNTTYQQDPCQDHVGVLLEARFVVLGLSAPPNRPMYVGEVGTALEAELRELRSLLQPAYARER